MSKTGQWFHKLCEDAEIMTEQEFINEHGEQYIDYYNQVQQNGADYE
tara:strand:+ start:450 stop:590 length:141 start_codon:yes stop_codon:yes gene_type:complete